MSKWLVPTQKGSELVSSPVRSPTVVRFEGVPPGSVEAEHLYKQFQPQISHFHRSQAQKYSLSTVENYRAHGVYPGLKMTYTNLHGQEMINIQVAAEIVEQVRAEISDYWDCAVIDIHVPGQTTWCNFAAFMVAPVLEQLTPTSGALGEHVNGVAYDSELWRVQDPLVAYPDGGDYAGDPVDNSSRLLATVTNATEQISSLRLDLRPLRGLSMVTVDIYGLAGSTEVLISHTLTGSELAAEIPFRVTGITLPTVNYAGYGPVRFYRLWLKDEVYELFPEVKAHGDAYGYYDWSDPVARNPYLMDGAVSYTSTFHNPGWSDTDPVVLTSAASQNFAPGNIENVATYWEGPHFRTKTSKYWKWFPGNDFGNWRYTPIADTSNPPNGATTYESSAGDWTQYYVPVYTDEWETQWLPQLATVRAAVFKGVPADAWSEGLGANASYRKWENSKHYPARWGTAQLAENVVIPAQAVASDTSVFNHFGLSKVGTITVDLVRGGISFKAAQ